MTLHLRPVRFADLPTLRRWRGIPSHLRHPGLPSWPRHLHWFWRTRWDASLWMRAVVTSTGRLCGTAGVAYCAHGIGELSVLCLQDEGSLGFREDFDTERLAIALVFQSAPVASFWAEVYPDVDARRRAVFTTQMLPTAILPAGCQRSPDRLHAPGATFYWYSRD